MDLFWTGTDVFFMNQYGKIRFRYKVKIFFFRLFVRILDKWYTGANWVISEHLAKELKLTKKIKVYTPPIDTTKYKKIEHPVFYILYYFPKTKNVAFSQWLYGWDIYLELKKYFGDKVIWITVDGSDDMSLIYPIVDFYIRPNRHDGYSFMVRECKIQNIPYYWSKENPDFDAAVIAIEKAMK